MYFIIILNFFVSLSFQMKEIKKIINGNDNVSRTTYSVYNNFNFF